MTDRSMLRARGLTKRFGPTTALAGVDLDAAPGEMLGVTGANGAGKTTLLRILATLLKPDAGSASVDGTDVVTGGDEVRRRIGVALVNERAVYWRLSALQNLVFFARLRGMSRREGRAESHRALEALGIAHLATRRASGLSAGQRQRLLLARALLGSPPVLLVDEPLRGLDDEGITRVRALLRGYADRGNTVLVAAPTLTDLEDLFDQIYVLEAGAPKDHRRIPRLAAAAGRQA